MSNSQPKIQCDVCGRLTVKGNITRHKQTQTCRNNAHKLLKSKVESLDNKLDKIVSLLEKSNIIKDEMFLWDMSNNTEINLTPPPETKCDKEETEEALDPTQTEVETTI